MTRSPRKWNLPLTYRPKIARVASGEIRQTIRPGLKYQVGDQVSFHGWEGQPYRSRWTGRTRYYELIHVSDITVYPTDLQIPWGTGLFNLWDDPIIDELARLDGIDPPSGEELGRLFNEMYDLPDDGMDFQILRW